MLDDAQRIQALDKSNALGVVAGQSGQLKQRFEGEVPEGITFRSIVVAGMGGSALAAEFIKSWLAEELPVPFEIVRDYHLPAFVDKHTLVIASSYSGNTEETLEALSEAEERGCKIIVMSSGGKLAERAAAKDYPYYKVQGGYQPRLAVLYGVKGLATILEHLKMLSGLVDELEEAAEWVSGETSAWVADVPNSDNRAKQIAMELLGHGVVMYGSTTLALPTLKWKIDFNENSKNVAFSYLLPEFSHNEFQGWSHPQDKQFLKVIQLHSKFDHPQVKKRFEISNRLLSGQMPSPLIVEAKGETRLEQILWTLLLGDFVSLYLAFLNGIDPSPVDLVGQLKRELA